MSINLDWKSEKWVQNIFYLAFISIFYASRAPAFYKPPVKLSFYFLIMALVVKYIFSTALK